MAAEMKVTEAALEAAMEAAQKFASENTVSMYATAADLLREEMRAAPEAGLAAMLEQAGRIKGMHGLDDFCCTREIGFVPMKDQAVFIIKETS